MTTVSEHHATGTIALVGGGVHVLDIKQASVELNEGWSPFAKVSVVCSLPTQAEREAIDPRQKLRAWVHLQQDFGLGAPARAFSAVWGGKKARAVTAVYGGRRASDVSRDYFTPWNAFGVRKPTTVDLDLTLRGRTFDELDGTMTLSLMSDEALLQSYKLVSRYSLAPSVATVRAAVNLALRYIGATLDDSSADASVPVDDVNSLVWNPGVSAWSYVYPLVQKAGLRLFADERRIWRLVPGTFDQGSLVSLSTNTNVKVAGDSISLDEDWYDAVVITYSWRDTLGATQVAYDVAGDVRAINVYSETRNVPFPGAGAAASILGRMQGRGRVIDVTSINDYSVRPGAPLAITLPATPIQTGNASSVHWNLPADEMTIKSRGLVDTPEMAWAFLPTGNRWQDSPPGASWAAERPAEEV